MTDKNKKVDVITSEPIVVYRESVKSAAGPVEGKSPNKHNRFYITVEPLEQSIYDAIQDGDIKEGKIKDKEEAQKFRDLFQRRVEKPLTHI